MKKWFFPVAASLIALSAAASPVTKKVKVSDFTGIVAGSTYDIKLICSNDFSVEVTYDSDFEKEVRVYTEGSNLVFAFETQESRRRGNKDVYNNVKLSAVVRMPALSYLRLSGAARLTTTDRFGAGSNFEGRLSGVSSVSGLKINGGSCRLEMSGASSVDLEAFFKRSLDVHASGVSKAAVKAEADEIRVENSGSSSCRLMLEGGADYGRILASGVSSVTVSGDVSDVDIQCSGSSHVDGAQLGVRNAQIECSGCSSVDLQHVSGEMRVSATGSSRISYGGDPRIVSQTLGRASSLVKK